MEGLPAHWLAHFPDLNHLSLEGRGWEGLPETWLSHAPRLEQLGLDFPDPTGSRHPVPEKLLTYAPGLTHLTLTGVLGHLRPGFIAYAPALTHLSLGTGEEVLPPRILARAPLLTHFKISARFLTTLPDDFLAHTPRLTHLDLFIPKLRTLPPEFLVDAPQLEDLAMRGIATHNFHRIALTALPAGFLTHTPRLTRLHISPSQVQSLPDGFLAHTPQLEWARLLFPEVQELPTGFLSQVPHLQRLDLDLRALGPTVPPGFLRHLPSVSYLRLWAEEVTHLSRGFLQIAPKLEELWLWLPQLADPPGPGDSLWPLLRAHGKHFLAGADGADVYASPSLRENEVLITIPAGTPLWVRNLHRDEDGHEWLELLMSTAPGLYIIRTAWVPAAMAEPTVQYREWQVELLPYPPNPYDADGLGVG